MKFVDDDDDDDDDDDLLDCTIWNICSLSEFFKEGLVCFSASGISHCLVPSEVIKHCQERYQYPAGVKSSTALILECRPWSVLVCFLALHLYMN